MQYYNIHAHIFTMNNAPKKFLHLYLPGPVADVIDDITDIQPGAWLVRQILEKWGGNGGKRYASFLKIGKSKSQLDVFRQLMEQYRETTFKFTGLTMQMEQCGAGSSASGYEGQLEEIIAVKKQFPENLLLFLGIDPRWKKTGKDLAKTVENYFNTKILADSGKTVYPFVGLKLYPCMGFYPFDERLKETFTWAADNEVPVLTHCSYLGGIYNNDAGYINSTIYGEDIYDPDPNGRPKRYPASGITYSDQKNFGRWLLGRQQSVNNVNRCSYYMEPNAYRSLMAYYSKREKPLKLCLAHFGGGNQISAVLHPGKQKEEQKTPYGVMKMNWHQQVKEMMLEFPSLYTDVAYALAEHDPAIHPSLIADILNPVYKNRIMFGTDYFLTEREGKELNTYEDFKEHAKTTGSGTAWDMAAHDSIEQFLENKYFHNTP